jgi:3-oxoacyl-[acyl-carrier protein] reductase
MTQRPASSFPDTIGTSTAGTTGHPLFQLAGQRILVTGASGGIGSAAIALCVELGAQVIAVDRMIAYTKPTIEGEGLEITSFFNCDVSDRVAVRSLGDAVGPIDALIDTAAICPYGENWLEDDWDASFRQVIDVNLYGPLNLARAFLPGMIERRQGRIVFTSSVAGWMGGHRSDAHYVASKGGLHAVVRWLAQRASRHNVLVNAVAPGMTKTPMIENEPYDPSKIPLGRIADPKEVAAALVFLCMPASSYFSGAILDVNGGVYFR